MLNAKVPLTPPVVSDGHSAASPHPEHLLPPSATTALRSWLQAERRARAAEVNAAEGLHVLREACDEARRRGAQVEQLIVLLKQMWATLPNDGDGDDPGAGRRDGEREALDRAVRLCIEEFYAPMWDAAGEPKPSARTDGPSADGTSTSA